MELLTVQETAQMLKVAPITIRRYISSGRLPAVKVGRAIRVHREDVDNLLTPVVPEGRPLTHEDSLWQIVGMFDSGPEAPSDVSANHHKYLADAAADLHEE